MITKTDSKIHIKANNLSFTFLNSGDIYKVSHHNTMINQLLTNSIDGSFNNIYLRTYKDGLIQATPLLGITSNSNISYSENQIVWEGTVEEIHYSVTFTLSSQGVWFWDVTLNGDNAEVDVIYGQDLGLADTSAVRSNEAYAAQYIDHAVFKDNKQGYVLCSRQNQPQQGGKFPYIQQGSLTKAIGFSTDGFQFFGLSYKETNEPEALTKPMLANDIYQYEFAYTALQTERVTLKGKHQVVFYGLSKENHPTAITSIEFNDEILEAWDNVKQMSHSSYEQIKRPSLSSDIGMPLRTLSMTKEEIDTLFPHRQQEEWEKDTLLSFFTETYEHVVLKEKELLVERPHGHILMNGNNVDLTTEVMTSTSYMFGVFNSQLTLGNTSFNKMMSNTRNALNLMKTSGQRIYVQLGNQYHLLTMPSMFEIGFSYVRWYYKTKDETFIITNYTKVDSTEVTLNVVTKSGEAYNYMVTNQITMNNNEYEVPFHYKQNGQSILFYADDASDSANTHPNLAYRLHVYGPTLIVENEQLLANHIEHKSASLVVLKLNAACKWTMVIQGNLHGNEMTLGNYEFDIEVKRYRDFYRNVMNHFHLSKTNVISSELEKVNILAWWYTHNMLVHYSVPHGLEQYGGAAWGTRDVCQGPTEYFMATQKYDALREVLKTVYSHQYEDNGNWPQWFMFDKYFSIQQDDSHGDIIVWPLKVLSDYLFITKDHSILEEQVPYTDRTSHLFTDYKATILDHAKKEINYIKDNFLHGTHLSSYGDGDWDDTLQPANVQLKKYMVSSWTVALTYQVISRLAQVLTDVDTDEADNLQILAENISVDFNKYMLSSGVIPGFVYMEKTDEVELMLHPTDTKTGINYRLLPMNRGIISELFSLEQAEAHYQIIKEHLSFPDGVRLMDHPASYKGGVSKHFKRAEQASNFGREIGLQYVHAHIRFIEAMAKLGKNEDVWNGLEVINPVSIQKAVPNAERRQSNTYFSSSDGKFMSRYHAQEHFADLRDGSAQVKGGWRIYSSGPGIYMNQLISNALGIRQEQGSLVIDPTLPITLDQLQFDFQYNGYPVKFNYHIRGNKVERLLINGKEVSTKEVKNRYRQSGVQVANQVIEEQLTDRANSIDIYMN